jgi:hypothetical protein
VRGGAWALPMAPPRPCRRLSPPVSSSTGGGGRLRGRRPGAGWVQGTQPAPGRGARRPKQAAAAHLRELLPAVPASQYAPRGAARLRRAPCRTLHRPLTLRPLPRAHHALRPRCLDEPGAAAGRPPATRGGGT